MTRQREALYTALENSTRITDLMTISMNSLGTAEEKMAAYSDSVEASQKRVTAAFEEWVLKMNASPVLKTFNNLLATTIENVDALAISLGAVFVLSQKNKIGSLGLEALEKLNEKFFDLGSLNFFSDKPKESGIKERFDNYIQEYSIDKSSKAIDRFNEELKLAGNALSDNTLKTIKQGQAILIQTNATEKLAENTNWLDWLQGKELDNAEQNNILQALGIKIAEEGQQKSLEELAMRELLSETLDEEIRQRIQNNAQLAQQARANVAGGIGATVGGISGGLAGGYWGNKIGGSTVGTIGSVAGSFLGGAAAKWGATALAGGTLSGAALIGPIAAIAIPILAALGAGISTWIEETKQKAIKEATEAAAEIENQYKSAISSSSDVQRYDELAKGVDTLGRNVSLTDDEYQEFLDTSNALAEVFPDLVVRTDEFGNKLLGTNDKVGTITDSIKTLTLEMQKSYNSSLLNTNLFEDELSKAQDAQEEYNKTLEKQGKYNTSISKDTLYNYRKSRGEATYLEKGNPEDYFEVGKAASANGSLLDTILQFESSDLEKEVAKKLFKEGIAYESIGNNVLAYSKDQEEEVSKIVNTIVSDGQEASEGIVTSAKNALDEVKNSLNSLVSSQLQASLGEENWNALTEEQQAGITAIAENISLFDKNGERKGLETYRQELRDLANNLQEILLENPLLFNVVYAEDSSMTISEMEKARQDLLAALVSLFPENASIEDMNEILIPSGFEFNGDVDVLNKEDWLSDIGKDSANKTVEEQNKAYAEYLKDLVYDAQDYRKRLSEKGINVDVGSISVENAKYAYESFSEEVIKSIDSIEDFQEALLNYKFADDDLSYLISEYERLNALSRDSTQETQFRQVSEYVRAYAQALGIASDNLDEIIEKAKLMPDMSIIGTSNKTVDEVQQQFETYQEIYDYLMNDYIEGQGFDANIYEKMMNDEQLAKFIVGKDMTGAVSYLEQVLQTEDVQLKSTFEGKIAASNELTKTLIANNQEYVDNLKEVYGWDLEAFLNLNDNKDIALKIQSGNFAEAWTTSVDKIKASFDNGIISVDEYNQKLQELRMIFFSLLGIDPGGILSFDAWKIDNDKLATDNTEETLNEYSQYVSNFFKNVSNETANQAMATMGPVLAAITTLLDNSGMALAEEKGPENLKEALEQYDELYKIYGKLDKTKQPEKFKKVEKAVIDYTNAITGLNDEIEAALPKAREFADTLGNPDATVSDVENKYKDYQEILDYLNSGEFNGKLNPEMADKIAGYDQLVPFLASDDIDELKNYLSKALEGADEEATKVFKNQLKERLLLSEESTKSLLASNDDWVSGIEDSYNINLNDFSTLAAAKYALDLALSGDIEGTWDTWVANMSEKYDQDFSNFTSKAAAKMAMLNAMAAAEGSQTFNEWVEDRNFAPGTYTLDEMMQIYQNESGYKLNSPDTWTGNLETVVEGIEEIVETVNVSVGGIGGSSSSGGGSSQTMEDVLNARKALINKEYEAMLVYDESTGKATHTKYFEKMKEVLNDQLEYYNSLLKTAQTESERLDTLQKIQNVQVELANLNDEELQDELNLAQTKEASLSAQIDIQNQLIEAADTEEERIQRQKELNDLIKQEYELRVSINDFQMSLLERQANRVNPDNPLYEDLINEQIEESQNNADLALEQIDRVREKLVKQYMSEKNPDGSFKYNIDEVRELVENSEEMQALYQTYLDNIDKATELVLEYASARLDRIDARINELEQTKPKEWTSIEQIIEYSDKNLDLLRGKIPILQEALSHSAEMTNEQIQSYVDQLNDVYAAIKEAEIQKQQDIIDYHDNVYDALTWQIQEYIDQIEKQKQVVEDYYDDEIDKINKVNDAKERTIELEKLQDEILNARKNKQRVNLNMPSIKIAV